MAKFLNCQGVSFFIGEIIDKAKEKIILVSPFLQINQLIKDKLINADKKNISIFIITGKNQLNEYELRQLTKLNSVRIFERTSLHAKCYINENSAIVTSMNLYEFSQQNNIEFGILLDKNLDEEAFADLVNEINCIVVSSDKVEILGDNNSWKNIKYLNLKLDVVECRKAILDSWRRRRIKYSPKSVDYYLNSHQINQIAYKQTLNNRDLLDIIKRTPENTFFQQQLMDLFYFWKNFDFLEVISVSNANKESVYNTVKIKFLESGLVEDLYTKEDLPEPNRKIITSYSNNKWLNEYYYIV